MKFFKEHLVSIFILIICAMWLIYSPKVSDSTLPGAPGPKFFPFIIVGLLIFLTLLYEILTFYQKKKKKPVNEGPPEVSQGGQQPEKAQPDKVQTPEVPRIKIIISFVLVFLYIVGIDLIGFYPATVIILFVALKGLIGLPGWIKSLTATAIISASIFIIFSVFFKLPLPHGVF